VLDRPTPPLRHASLSVQGRRSATVQRRRRRPLFLSTALSRRGSLQPHQARSGRETGTAHDTRRVLAAATGWRFSVRTDVDECRRRRRSWRCRLQRRTRRHHRLGAVGSHATRRLRRIQAVAVLQQRGRG